MALDGPCEGEWILPNESGVQVVYEHEEDGALVLAGAYVYDVYTRTLKFQHVN